MRRSRSGEEHKLTAVAVVVAVDVVVRLRPLRLPPRRRRRRHQRLLRPRRLVVAVVVVSMCRG